MDGSLGHPGEDIIFNVEVCSSKDINTKLGHNQSGELKNPRATTEGGMHFSKDGELGLAINLDGAVACSVNLKIEKFGHLEGDDACSGPGVQHEVDGTGVVGEGKDWTLGDINPLDPDNRARSYLGKAGPNDGAGLSVIGLKVFTILIHSILITGIV